MRWPWVSRVAFDLVTAQCINLLEEKKILLLKIEHLERAIFKAMPTAEAQEYMRRIEPPAPPEVDPEPKEPTVGSPWEAWSDYFVEHEAWTERRKKIA